MSPAVNSFTEVKQNMDQITIFKVQKAYAKFYLQLSYVQMTRALLLYYYKLLESSYSTF